MADFKLRFCKPEGAPAYRKKCLYSPQGGGGTWKMYQHSHPFFSGLPGTPSPLPAY